MTRVGSQRHKNKIEFMWVEVIFGPTTYVLVEWCAASLDSCFLMFRDDVICRNVRVQPLRCDKTTIGGGSWLAERYRVVG